MPSSASVVRSALSRLAHAFSNLIRNAVQHGSPNALIRVTASGEQPQLVTVSITNEGRPIPRDQIGGLFDAMKSDSNGRDRRHLGLGLYIVDKIVEAHGAESTCVHPRPRVRRSSFRFLGESLPPDFTLRMSVARSLDNRPAFQ